MKRSQLLATAIQIPLDYLMLYGAFYLAYAVRDTYQLPSPQDLGGIAERINYTGVDLVSQAHYLHYVNMIVPLMVLAAAITGIYTVRRGISWFQKIFQVIVAVSFAEMLVVLLFLLKGSFFLPRSSIVLSWGFAIVGMLIVRIIMAATMRSLRRAGVGVYRVWLVGTKREQKEVLAKLTAQPAPTHQVIASYDDAEKAAQALREATAPNRPDILLVCGDHIMHDHLAELRNASLECHVEYALLPPFLTNLPAVFAVEEVATLPLVFVRPTPLEGWGVVLKRTYDIIASSLLLILFSPLYLIIYIMMKFTSPGPIIFKHRRLGKNQEPIEVWKFRTMYANRSDEAGGLAFLKQYLEEHPEAKKEWDATQKLRKDPRVSPIGRFLRATSLDELPQFVNVLTGQLSLVGPRPILEKERHHYGERDKALFAVRPGLTGLWQVSGRSDVSYEERVRLDMHYIEHWSLWLDLSITARTGIYMVKAIIGKAEGAV